MPAEVSDGSGRIEVHMGPSPLVHGGDNLEEAIVRFIDGAVDKLEIAVQELESEPIATAIVRAKIDRGVRVRVVLEQDYLRESTNLALANPWQPIGPGRSRGNEPNREALAALLRSKIDVRADYNSRIFHQKFIVRDRGQPTSAVLTGSTNFTPTGTTDNLNHVIIVHDDDVNGVYNSEFSEIWSGNFGKRSVRHNDKPKEFRVAGIRVKPLFAPEHSPEMEVMKQITKVRRRVDFAMFTFSKTSGVDDTLKTLEAWDVEVRGVLDGGQGSQSWAPTDELAALSNFHIYLAYRGTQGHDGHRLRKLHHKLLVVDDNLLIGGSFNYTGPANQFNDENILVLGDVEETDPVAVTNQRTLARYARRGIDHIIETFGTRI